MCSLMLFHVVLSGEGFVADGAVNTLFPCMLLAVTSGMAGCGEGSAAVVRLCVRARILVLFNVRSRVVRRRSAVRR